MEKGRKGAALWLAKKLKNVLWQVLFLAFLGILISYISVRFALASRELLDFAQGASQKSFASCVITIVLLLFADISVQSLYNIFSVRLASRYRNRMQKNLFSSIVGADYGRANEYHTGETINRLTKDVRTVSANLIDLIPSAVILVSGVVMSFVALFGIDRSLAIICIALGPIILASSILYGKKVKKLHKNTLESDGKILSFMQESIQNTLVIKAFRRERQIKKIVTALQDENYKLNMRVGYVSLLVNVLYFLSLTAAYYFAVAWCARKIHLGIMTVGSFAAIIQLVGSVQSPFKEISSSLTQFFLTLASAERIAEMEQLPMDATKNAEINDFQGIEVESVSFSYDSKSVLTDISFSMQKGDMAAFTGGSGEGKSTLLKLLMGIYSPDKGDMHIYNKEEKIKIGAKTRSAFCYVPQGNMLLSGTVLQNITFFDDNPDVQRAREAARCACILEHIDSLPQSMETELGEGGQGFSEGQLQRLAIARAIYASSPVLLLDEATSALDAETELKVLKNIRSIKDKSAIIITHRPAALDIANKRLHIENGQAFCE